MYPLDVHSLQRRNSEVYKSTAIHNILSEYFLRVTVIKLARQVIRQFLIFTLYTSKREMLA